MKSLPPTLVPAPQVASDLGGDVRSTDRVQDRPPRTMTPLADSPPFEIIVMIIGESEREDLPAWCLVSSDFDRGARPLLWRELAFEDEEDVVRTMESISLYVSPRLAVVVAGVR